MDGTPTTVRLQNLLAAEGDADGDRDVDVTDFNVLASHFDPAGDGYPNNGPFWDEGNFDGDDDTDITRLFGNAKKVTTVGDWITTTTASTLH